MGFYLTYLATWPEYFMVEEAPHGTGRLSCYSESVMYIINQFYLLTCRINDAQSWARRRGRASCGTGT